jgi:hypothetical protein
MKTGIAYEKKYRRVKAKLLDSQYTLSAYLSIIEAERNAIRHRNGVTHQRLHRWIKRLLDGVRPGTLVAGKQTIATNMLDSLLVELQDEARYYYLNSDELLAECELCKNRRLKKVTAR